MTTECTPMTAATESRFQTLVAIRRGGVYVRAAACPASGWMVRADDQDPTPVPQPLAVAA